jgi:PEP-CTERM motif
LLIVSHPALIAASNQGTSMTRLKTLVAALSAIGLFAVSGASHALPSLTFTDSAAVTHVVDPFNGFDWQSNATAVVSAPVFDGTTILTTNYLASAEVIKLTGGANGTPAGLGTTYEFTVKATIFEVATCLVPAGPVCLIAGFTAVGGTYDIYYDSTVDADILTGNGFVNGTKIVSGTINPGFAGTFSLLNATSGSGIFSFAGAVGFTETDNTKDAYFAPTLAASNASATLQIGGATTSWTAPTSWVDGGGIPAGALVFQADGNQAFIANVPEPGSLALVGLSLVGLAFARRSVAKK